MSYSSVILATSGLIGYWRLGEPSGTDMFDASASGADGTYGNSPTLGAASLISNDASDTAATFLLSANSYGYIATGIPAGSTTGATIELWAKWTDMSTDRNIRSLVRWGAQLSTVGYHWLYCDNRYDDRDLKWQWSNGSSLQEAETDVLNGPGIIEELGNPIHIVGVHDYTADTVKFYVNGSQAGPTLDVSGGGTPQQVGVDSPTYIAAFTTSTYNTPEGTLDEVALYNVALSQATIEEHYAAAFVTTVAVSPDADIATTGWTTTPLWSKIDDDPDAPDGTVISATLS